jgi:hypothetical protein
MQKQKFAVLFTALKSSFMSRIKIYTHTRAIILKINFGLYLLIGVSVEKKLDGV